MKRWSIASVLVVFVAAAGVAVGAEKKKEKDGWQSLFNGKDLEGWEQHGGKAVYRVEDGAIMGHSVPNTSNSFLCTKKRFGDFELTFEVKVDNGLNSGVQIRSNIKENDRVFGPQVEIEAAPGEAGYIYGEATGRGWLSQDRSKKDAFKNGEWNRYRVLAKGDNVRTWINDKPIADLTDEKSSREGLIGLQVHGVGGREESMYVRWRNIKIRELK
ncbi:MAG: 3-keto-disaccharide hydrolase [Planctomycetota bacterium]